jgi:hypothetical protein
VGVFNTCDQLGTLAPDGWFDPDRRAMASIATTPTRVYTKVSQYAGPDNVIGPPRDKEYRGGAAIAMSQHTAMAVSGPKIMQINSVVGNRFMIVRHDQSGTIYGGPSNDVPQRGCGPGAHSCSDVVEHPLMHPQQL